MKPYIAVDLDGTLAVYNGWRGPKHIGEPIPAMIDRVKGWLGEGKTVKILTARVSHDGTVQRRLDSVIAELAIRDWCLRHIGRELDVTCCKDYGMIELWDDRAVRVVHNTGNPCCGDV